MSFVPPTKVACVPCSRGKRKCNGQQPCERCARLGKECFYDHPDVGAGSGGGASLSVGGAGRKRRRSLPLALFIAQQQRLGLVRGGPAVPLPPGAPPPTLLSLPELLFPWRAIELVDNYRNSSSNSGVDASALGGRMLDGPVATCGLVPREACSEAQLRLLWGGALRDQHFPGLALSSFNNQVTGGTGQCQASPSASASSSSNHQDGHHGEGNGDAAAAATPRQQDDNADEDDAADASQSHRASSLFSSSASARPVRQRRGWAAEHGYAEEDNDDGDEENDGGDGNNYYDAEDDDHGNADGGGGGDAAAAAAAAAAVNYDLADLQLRELLAIESIQQLQPPPPPPPPSSSASNSAAAPVAAVVGGGDDEGGVPAFVSVLDPSTHKLVRIVANDACLALFGWSQAEIDLRVQTGAAGSAPPLRWLHPCDVLPRSAAALTSLRDGLPEYTCTGHRYLRRRVPSAPHPSLPVLMRALSVLSAAITSSSPSSSLANNDAAAAAAATAATGVGSDMDVGTDRSSRHTVTAFGAGASSSGGDGVRGRGRSASSASSMTTAAALAALGALPQTAAASSNASTGGPVVPLSRDGGGLSNGSAISNSSGAVSAVAAPSAVVSGDDVVDALDDVDECCEYEVITAVEHVTQQFADVSVVSSSSPAAHAAGGVVPPALSSSSSAAAAAAAPLPPSAAAAAAAARKLLRPLHLTITRFYDVRPLGHVHNTAT